MMKVAGFGTGTAGFCTLPAVVVLMLVAFIGTHTAYFFAKQ
jgi:hypothetical protein